MGRTAVVLFNMGGPDGLEAVKPFLFNLFNDPAIIGAPRPVRWLLARWISARRAPIARGIYEKIGGRSPIVDITRSQAKALEQALADDEETRVFVAMRYWHPRSDEAAAAVKAFGPDDIVLLPLYPQFSTTTSESSLKDWHRAAKAAGIDVPTRAVCCYPDEPGFIDTLARGVRAGIDKAGSPETVRVLFSAHGLPKKIIDGGDPYAWQVERTAAAIVSALNIRDLDWVVCYQSRVGPLEWIGPATPDELKRAAEDGRDVVIVPIAFVSEHSETLVELDLEYGEEARELGIGSYIRVPTVGTDARFIEGLARLVRKAREQKQPLCNGHGETRCPGHAKRCPVAG